jgi:O-methyltransferase
VQREQTASRLLWGFDSFCGLPEPTAEDASPRHPKRGELAAELENLIAVLHHSGIDDDTLAQRIKLIPGFFHESLPSFPDRPIALLHIDADLYQSYREVLQALFPKVTEGGVVLFDEYGGANWPGATQAVDEYFMGSPYRIQRDCAMGKHYLVQSAPAPDGGWPR